MCITLQMVRYIIYSDQHRKGLGLMKNAIFFIANNILLLYCLMGNTLEWLTYSTHLLAFIKESDESAHGLLGHLWHRHHRKKVYIMPFHSIGHKSPSVCK